MSIRALIAVVILTFVGCAEKAPDSADGSQSGCRDCS